MPSRQWNCLHCRKQWQFMVLCHPHVAAAHGEALSGRRYLVHRQLRLVDPEERCSRRAGACSGSHLAHLARCGRPIAHRLRRPCRSSHTGICGRVCGHKEYAILTTELVARERNAMRTTQRWHSPSLTTSGVGRRRHCRFCNALAWAWRRPCWSCPKPSHAFSCVQIAVPARVGELENALCML